MRQRRERAEYQILLSAMRRGEQHSFHSAADLLKINTKNARYYIELARAEEGVFIARWGRGPAGPAYPILAWSPFERENAPKLNRVDRQRINRQRRNAIKNPLGNLVKQLMRPTA